MKLFYSLSLATLISFFLSLVLLLVFSLIVNFFQLNEGRDAYWVFDFTILAAVITWIVSFGHFMSWI